MRLPYWKTVTVCPPTVNVPVRVETSCHGAMRYVTVAGPAPLVGETEIQSQFGRARHDERVSVGLTVTVPVSPSRSTSTFVLSTVASSPFCVTVCVCPAT